MIFMPHQLLFGCGAGADKGKKNLTPFVCFYLLRSLYPDRVSEVTVYIIRS